MKSNVQGHRIGLFGISLTATVVALVLSGCVSANYEKGEAAASGLKDAAVKVETGEKKVDETLGAMNDLVQNPRADLRPQYKRFSSSVDELGALAKHVKQSFESMSAQGKSYFARWEKEAAEIRNEDLRAQSVARKAEVSAALENVKRIYAETEIAFQPFMADLRDIQKYLGTDLTTGGVVGLRNTAAKATANGAKVKDSLSHLAGEFRKMGVSMASSAEPPKTEAAAK
jgi:hypothetical protein